MLFLLSFSFTFFLSFFLSFSEYVSYRVCNVFFSSEEGACAGVSFSLKLQAFTHFLQNTSGKLLQSLFSFSCKCILFLETLNFSYFDLLKTSRQIGHIKNTIGVIMNDWTLPGTNDQYYFSLVMFSHFQVLANVSCCNICN